MKITKTKFKGLVIIQKQKFLDNRGYFLELYKKKIINKRAANIKFYKKFIFLVVKKVSEILKIILK